MVELHGTPCTFRNKFGTFATRVSSTGAKETGTCAGVHSKQGRNYARGLHPRERF